MAIFSPLVIGVSGLPQQLQSGDALSGPGNGLSITQAAASGVAPTVLTVTGAALTAIPAGTEDVGVNFNFAATKQWATGDFTSQREVLFQAPRYAFSGASTITTAATVAITGGPTSGTNATITNKLALWIQSGNSWMNDKVGIGGGSGAHTPAALLHLIANNSDSFSATSPQLNFGASVLYMENQNQTANTFVSILLHNTIGSSSNDGYVRLSAVGTANSSAAFVVCTSNNGNLNSRVYIDPTGNVGIGTGLTPAAASTLHVVASQSVAAAAGAVWNGINFAASTLTLTGATTPVTTLNFVTIAAPTVTAASAVVITDFFTCRIGAATFTGAGPASATRRWSLGVDGNAKFGGGITVHSTDINSAGPYTILETDFLLGVRYTATAAISLNLPAIATVGDGHIVGAVDSGYNASGNNIGWVPSGADMINNVAGTYLQNVTGSTVWLRSNAATLNWELV